MRTPEEIKQEWLNLISELGDLVHRCEVEIPSRINALKAQISNVKKEHEDTAAALAVATRLTEKAEDGKPDAQ